MRTVVTLCLLAVLCTVNADPTSDIMEMLKLQVRNTKWAVDNVIQQLGHLRIQIKEDTLMVLMKKWGEHIEVYRNYINLLVKAMHDEVEAAKVKGADAQKCYDVNFQGISDTSATAHDDSAKCKDTAETSIENSFGFIDTLTETGNTLIGQLDNIFLECHHSDSLRMQSCIIAELEEINRATEAFETDANSAERVIQPISNYIILQADQCSDEIYTIARFNSEESKLSCSRCVEKALKDVTA